MLLNLISNGFYATDEARARQANGKPTSRPSSPPPGTSATASRSASATTAPAFRPRCGRGCSIRSSRPSRPAREPASACRSATTSSSSSMPARSRSTPSPASSPSSGSCCRAARRSLGQIGRTSVSLLILVVDDEPDVEALFRQQFRRDLRAGRFVDGFRAVGRPGAGAASRRRAPPRSS